MPTVAAFGDVVHPWEPMSEAELSLLVVGVTLRRRLTRTTAEAGGEIRNGLFGSGREMG